VRVAHIKIVEDQDPWLIRGLWGREAVGFVGGTPKSLKTWMALEMCVAVASGSPCLGRFAVTQPGHVLLYAAEDAAEDIRHRVEGIARARRLDFERLAVGLITEPILRLDLPEHQLRLADTVAKIKPRLLVLDPLVRLHRGDENSASDVSGLLGFLRLLQREHHLAIVLVHHIRKANASQPGQALRGSGGQEGQTALEVSTREPACTGSLPVRRAGRQGPCRGERDRPRDGHGSASRREAQLGRPPRRQLPLKSMMGRGAAVLFKHPQRVDRARARTAHTAARGRQPALAP
jgi:hypothetical protein